MNNNEILTLRMNMLGSMNTYVRDVLGDDEATDYWNTWGVPDEATEEDLWTIAIDTDVWATVCSTFGHILKNYDKTYIEEIE